MTIGVFTSSFAEGLQAEERKYRGVFEHSQAGVFTFDIRTLRILELNEKCARMLRYERDDLAGKYLSGILSSPQDSKKLLAAIGDLESAGDVELMFLTRDGMIREFLVSASITSVNEIICSAIDVTERKLADCVIQKAKDDLEIRVRERTEELQQINEELQAEIRERKRFENAIQLANRKLNPLSSITRHDILNQINAIVMYLSLAEHLKRIGQITQQIQKQIRFTRDYQNIGASAPQWQNVDLTIRDAVRDLYLGTVVVEHELDGLEIFADYLLERVFYNLVENSLRHGEKVTKVRFYSQETPAGMILVCDDNGVGVPAAVKDKIFRREYYRHTGYGLFLAQEILSITGMSIRETGEPGKGARFGIMIPKGGYRLIR